MTRGRRLVTGGHYCPLGIIGKRTKRWRKCLHERKRVWPSFGLEGGTSVCGLDIQWFPDYNKRRFRYFVLTFMFKLFPLQIAGGRVGDPQQRSFIYFPDFPTPCKIHCELLAMVDFISSRLVSPFI